MFLDELYNKNKCNFSKSDYKIMNYLLHNKEQLQYLTTEQLANQLNISLSTISRFWTKLGVKNLKELKLLVRDKETVTPSSRLSSAITNWKYIDFIDEYSQKYETNIKKTLQKCNALTLYNASVAIYKAKKVFVFAPDASIGLAHILQYRLRRLGIEMIFIKSGSEIYEYMINIKSEDIVLIFSFSRILNESIILLKHCQQIDCQSILMTDILTIDNGLSPDFPLFCYRGDPNDYHSMVSPMILLDIIILNITKLNPNSMKNSQNLEKFRNTYSDFIKR